MNAKEFAAAIRARKTVYGTCITMPSPHMVKFVDSLGTDFLFIDTEHIPQDREMVAWMCHAFAGKGQFPLVRIPSPDPYEVSKVIDGGAMGVLIPYCETLEQVKRCGAAVKYRPIKGEKLQRILNGEKLPEDEQKYIDKFNEDRLFFVNIESLEGIRNLDAMLDTGLVDGIIIGPHDLSCSIGKPEQYDDPEFEKRVLQIIDICVKHGVSIGNHFSTDRERHIEWARHGMNIILNSADMTCFVDMTKDNMSYLRAQIDGQKVENGEKVII